MPHVLVIGAKSDIAKALSAEYAKKGYDLYLSGRDEAELKKIADDLQIRYKIKAEAFELDVLDFASHEKIYKNLSPAPAGVLCVAGYLGSQEEALTNFSEARKIIDTNYTGCVSILNIIANDFEKNSKGFIIGISSVAGDRGRQSNYFYGSAKAGFTAYLSGLRNRLSKSGVQVITVKPGFVNTKMTEKLDLPGLLTAEPEEVSKNVIKAHLKGKDILYTKWSGSG